MASSADPKRARGVIRLTPRPHGVRKRRASHGQSTGVKTQRTSRKERVNGIVRSRTECADVRGARLAPTRCSGTAQRSTVVSDRRRARSSRATDGARAGRTDACRVSGLDDVLEQHALRREERAVERQRAPHDIDERVPPLVEKRHDTVFQHRMERGCMHGRLFGLVVPILLVGADSPARDALDVPLEPPAIQHARAGHGPNPVEERDFSEMLLTIPHHGGNVAGRIRLLKRRYQHRPNHQGLPGDGRALALGTGGGAER